MNKIYIKENIEKLEDDFKYDEENKSFYVEDNDFNKLKYFQYLENEVKFNYNKIESSNQNIYIGQNIGKIILSEILNSTKRLYILNSYSKKYMYDYLQDVKNSKNEDFALKIVSSIKNIDSLYSKYENLENENNLLKEKKDEIIKIGNDKLVSDDMLKKLTRWIKILQILLVIMIPILCFIVFKKHNFLWSFVLIFNLFLFAFLIFYNELNNRKKNSSEFLEILEIKGKEYNELLEIFAYDCNNFDNNIRKYSSLDSILVKLTREENVKINSKLIIVDDKAYLGSFDLSIESCFENVESLIEIKDEIIVEKLVKRFEEIYDNVDSKIYEKLLEMLENLNKWEGR